MYKWMNLGDLLLRYELISRKDLEEGLAYKKGKKMRLGEALVELGKITMEDIDYILSKQLDIPFVIVEDVVADIELLNKFEKKLLISHRVLPLYETDEHIAVVIQDPYNRNAIEYIKEVSGKDIKISAGSGSRIELILKQAFNKLGLPDLVRSINAAVEKITGTSFYRLDFLLTEYSCAISVFGSGIRRHMDTVRGHFSDDDVFSALGDLGIPFLYRHATGNGRKFTAVYPLVHKVNFGTRPAIVGEYGLFLPDDTIFTDADVNGAHQVFRLERPLPGYRYFSTQRPDVSFRDAVYTIDAAPDTFENYYIKLCVPKKCASCGGSGCALCNDLGYTFRKVEGVYSSDDLNDMLKED